MSEIWQQLVDFEKEYTVSSLGRIRSFATGLIMATPRHKSGYIYVCLTKQKKHKSLSLHRLIARTFIPNPDNKSTVNHKNGNKEDNRVVNLEWATRKENIKHTFTHLGRKSTWFGKTGSSHPISKSIKCVSDGKSYESISAAAKYYKIGETSIGEVCSGKRNSVYGLKFKYA